MLLECPDCHGKMSSRAVACPHCGLPVAANQEWDAGAGAPAMGRRVQTIEKTGKRWKAQILIGAGMAIVGAMLHFWTWEPWTRDLGGVLLGLGLLAFVVGRIMAWWHHG